MSVVLIPDPWNALRLILEMLLAEKSRFGRRVAERGERGRVLFPHIISFCTEPPRVLFKSLASLCKVTVDSHTRRCSYHPPAQHAGCLAYNHFYATPQRPGLSIIIKEGSGCKACPAPVSVICVCTPMCVCPSKCIPYVSCIILVQEIIVTEGGASQMGCEVSFQLPDAIMAVWRFADEVHGRPSRGGFEEQQETRIPCLQRW